jgi:hypothetical protein
MEHAHATCSLVVQRLDNGENSKLRYITNKLFFEVIYPIQFRLFVWRVNSARASHKRIVGFS